MTRRAIRRRSTVMSSSNSPGHQLFPTGRLHELMRRRPPGSDWSRESRAMTEARDQTQDADSRGTDVTPNAAQQSMGRGRRRMGAARRSTAPPPSQVSQQALPRPAHVHRAHDFTWGPRVSLLLALCSLRATMRYERYTPPVVVTAPARPVRGAPRRSASTDTPVRTRPGLSRDVRRLRGGLGPGPAAISVLARRVRGHQASSVADGSSARRSSDGTIVRPSAFAV